VHRHIECDRSADDLATACPELTKFVEETGNLDAVIDFSAYGPNETKSALELLDGRSGLYVLISTDSIYDVTAEEVDSEKKTPATENDDQRPEDEGERLRLATHHQYGHRKLQAEEVLRESGVDHVILRLPDVIGPRDTTFRFWLYQVWVKLASHFKDHPVQVPYFLKDYALSFVYVEDVAHLLVQLVVHTIDDAQVNQAFNLAWPVTITLEELLRTVAGELEPSNNMGINIDETGTAPYFYPSVRRGPISTRKAEELLGWTPTPFETAVKDSVTFYEAAMKDKQFVKQRDEIIQIAFNHLFSSEGNAFFEKLEELYDIDMRNFLKGRGGL
jgi:nucleoside-diphosphate-sugar epimerase